MTKVDGHELHQEPGLLGSFLEFCRAALRAEQGPTQETVCSGLTWMANFLVAANVIESYRTVEQHILLYFGKRSLAMLHVVALRGSR
jgi:hypothetical protein